MELEDAFQSGDKEEIEQALYSDETGLVVNVDWREEEEDIVQYFADATGEDLTAERTDEDDLAITYEGKTVDAGLQGDMGDRYRALRTLRTLLSEKYEMRIIKSSLLGDTHSFVIKNKEWWQQLDKKFGALTAETFAPFTDDIEFS